VSHELASQNIITKLYEPGAILSPFHERAAREHVGNGGIESCDQFLEGTNVSSEKLAAGAAAAEKIAECLHAAAADGTDRLRYCTPYGVEKLVNAKRELDNREYDNFLFAQCFRESKVIRLCSNQPKLAGYNRRQSGIYFYISRLASIRKILVSLRSFFLSPNRSCCVSGFAQLAYAPTEQGASDGIYRCLTH